MDYKVSRWKEIKQELIKVLIKECVGLIPEPTLGTIFRVISRRFFRLLELQESWHLHHIWEHINNAELGIDESPLSNLEEDNRHRAGVFVISRDASFFKRAIFRRKTRHYLRELRKDREQVEASLTWLDRNGYQFDQRLNQWFGILQKDGRRKLFILSRHFLAGDRPITALDYHRPESIRVGRNVADVGQLVLDVVDPPVPFLRSGVRLLYKYLVMRPIEKAKSYEARLSAHLLYRIGQGETAWERELEILLSQRINPFMLDRQEEKIFLNTGRIILGCEQKSLLYLDFNIRFTKALPCIARFLKNHSKR